MPKKETVPVTPSVLRWAREAAGYGVAEIAKKLSSSQAQVLGWESGEKQLTQGRLDALAKLYHRSTAFFFMPEAPEEEFEKPTDFRDAPADLTPGLIFQIRHSKERRTAALELVEGAGEPHARFTFKCRVDESPTDVAKRLRKLLGIDAATQLGWKSDAVGYSALGGWKGAAEAQGVLVFQGPAKDMNGASGFSIYEDPFPLVVIRSDDSPKRRCFSLLHELTHLGLRVGGICDLHDANTELFCNKVAACVLMPESALTAALREVPQQPRNGWSSSVLGKLARNFSVSEEALLLRLVDLNKADWDFYLAKRPEYAMRRWQPPKGDSKSGPPPHIIAVARNGVAFSKMVIDAYVRGDLTEFRASTYLRVGHQHVPKIEEALAARTWKEVS